MNILYIQKITGGKNETSGLDLRMEVSVCDMSETEDRRVRGESHSLRIRGMALCVRGQRENYPERPPHERVEPSVRGARLRV